MEKYSFSDATEVKESLIVLNIIDYKNVKLHILLEKIDSKPDRLYKINNQHTVDPEILVDYLQEHWNLSLDIAAELINAWNKKIKNQNMFTVPLNSQSGLKIENRETNTPNLKWEGMVDDDCKDFRKDDSDCKIALSDLPDYLSLSGIEKTSYSKTELIAVRDHIMEQVEGIFGILLAKNP